MSSRTPERPTMPDDLDQAYARAHALTDDGRGPSAAVRANVLAAAQDVAAQAAARVDVDAAAAAALTPVAAPVAAVGRGRPPAVNLSSWRVRAGAAFCAALLVGVVGWHFDASRRSAGDMQVASVDKSLEVQVVPQQPPMRLAESPAPAALSLPPAPVDVPPRAADAVAADAASSAEPVAKSAKRHKDVVVAQADQVAGVAAAPLQRAETHDELRNTDVAASPPIVFATPAPAPVVIASNAPRAAYGAPAPAPRIALAPVAPQITATSVAPPVAQPRLAGVAPPAPAAPVARLAQPEAAVAAAAPPTTQRVEVTGSSIRFSSAATSDAASSALGASAKAASIADGRLSLRIRPTPLHLAANDDDVETMNKLLADPATQVDATDTQGRTPLMYAVMAQHVRAVRTLLGAGADPDRADQSGATPRSVARTGVNAEIAALLAVGH